KRFVRLPRARGRFFRSPCSRTSRALAPPPNRGQTPLIKLPASAVSSLLSILVCFPSLARLKRAKLFGHVSPQCFLVGAVPSGATAGPVPSSAAALSHE